MHILNTTHGSNAVLGYYVSREIADAIRDNYRRNIGPVFFSNQVRTNDDGHIIDGHDSRFLGYYYVATSENHAERLRLVTMTDLTADELRARIPI